jgi:hypothetical protein
MQLLPDCSPQSVLRILDLAKLTQCSGCRLYRAEGRGKLWDSNGGHISKVNKLRELAEFFSPVRSTLKHNI